MHYRRLERSQAQIDHGVHLTGGLEGFPNHLLQAYRGSESAPVFQEPRVNYSPDLLPVALVKLNLATSPLTVQSC